MAESDEQRQHRFEHILHLFSSIGYTYPEAQRSSSKPADMLTAGLAWCIDTLSSHQCQSNRARIDGKDGFDIEESLRSAGCPYHIQTNHVESVDVDVVFPVVEWLVERVRRKQEEGLNEGPHSLLSLEEGGHGVEQLGEEAGNSVKMLTQKLDELNQRKVYVTKELHTLQEKISKDSNSQKVQKLILLMDSLKTLDTQDSFLKSSSVTQHSKIEAQIIDLEQKIASGCDDNLLSDELNCSLIESLDQLDCAKRELATRLRAVVAVKRQLDDIPCQSELIQYERRSSELVAHIQDKHRQTRKLYATYNALLEKKELMMKEISLLNSIISQFQDAFSNPAGRTKLIDSMEGIVKSTQQKLDKVQQVLHEEERACKNLKERYAGAITAQKRYHDLLKTLEDEFAKNEKLRIRSCRYGEKEAHKIPSK